MPIYILFILIRITKGKDNISSLLQRLGFANCKKPARKIIWIHAASIGESIAAKTLLDALLKQYPQYYFLITTGTITSADLIKKSLPKRSIHQFLPIDNLLIVRKFLNHWQPDLGIVMESELWPCLITEASKNTTLVLANARLSDKSYERWLNKKWLLKTITDKFRVILVQSKLDLYKYQQLGCNNLLQLDNLKFANRKLDYDQQQAQELSEVFAGKKLFVAASTHREDEEIILPAIKALKKEQLNYYPIIVLRHPERRNEISIQCKKMGLKYSIRSNSSGPSLKDDLYIVDTFKELGLFYNLAFMVFVGGSFKQGGHNLVEPACFDNIILLGPDMSNHQDITDSMTEKKAAIQIQTKEELITQMKFLLDEKNINQTNIYRQNALKYANDNEGIINQYLEEIRKILQ
jgi:3-deoxy-D-manno-octulosonic-acid transferase